MGSKERSVIVDIGDAPYRLLKSVHVINYDESAASFGFSGLESKIKIFLPFWTLLIFNSDSRIQMDQDPQPEI